MPNYGRRRRSNDPLRDLFVDLIAIAAAIPMVCGLYWFLSQPRMWTFNFPAASSPAPNPVVLVPESTGPDWGFVLALGILAMALVGVGLLFFEGIAYAKRLASQPKRPSQSSSAAAPGVPHTTRTSAFSIPVATIHQPVPVMPPASSPLDEMAPASDAFLEARPVMSEFERSFFWALTRAIGDRYYIFPQFPLRNLVAFGDEARFSHDLRGMYQNGQIDFLLADPSTLQAVLALEFDDPSHRQADAQARDRRKDEFLARARLAIARIKSNGQWNSEEIRWQIETTVVPGRAVAILQNVERSAFGRVREAKPANYVFPKVPLRQIIHLQGRLPKDKFLALESGSVDLLLAHPQYLGPLLAIEIDRSMHGVDLDLLKQARIKHMFLGGTSSFSPQALSGHIDEFLNAELQGLPVPRIRA